MWGGVVVWRGVDVVWGEMVMDGVGGDVWGGDVWCGVVLDA